MGTALEVVQDIAGDPHRVAALLRTPAFITDKCSRTGSLESSATDEPTSDGGHVLTITRVLPAEVPSFAKRLVGETITLTEIQTWGPQAEDGSADATAEVKVGGPMSFTGTITMRAGGTGTLITTRGTFKASVPLVGGKLEGLVADATRSYLRVENEVADEWLAREG